MFGLLGLVAILTIGSAVVSSFVPDHERKKKRWEEACARKNQELDLLAKYVRIMNSR